ncbi:MAG: hypothetical protein Q9217_006564 [Psora testacea]
MATMFSSSIRSGLGAKCDWSTRSLSCLITTILENIGYGFVGSLSEGIASNEKVKRVEEAAKIACVHEFIMSLPRGYQTAAGSRGLRLSGGQKQRIAIARAIVADPRILILDEATSTLDTDTEALVRGALTQRNANKTTIVIAYRLSTIRNADHIVYLSSGAAVEQGTHIELMEREGAYYELVQTQSVVGDESTDEHIPD